MADLIYSVLLSLDGYIADEEGNFDWAEPDEEVHSFINTLERPVGTYLFGRRMYEIMAVWETFPTHDLPAYIAEFADIWRAAEKVVYSSGSGERLHPKNPDRTEFRTRGSPSDEGLFPKGHRDRRTHARGAGLQGRPGRCLPLFYRAGCRGKWQKSPARWSQTGSHPSG